MWYLHGVLSAPNTVQNDPEQSWNEQTTTQLGPWIKLMYSAFGLEKEVLAH
jgi:hypothetical protein